MSDQSPGEGQPQFPPPQQYPGQTPEPTQPGYPNPSQYPAPPAYQAPYPPQPGQPPQNPYAPQYGAGPWTPPGSGRDPDKRPGTVTAAVVITWISTTLALLGILVVLALVAADNDDLFNELVSETDEFSRADLRTGLIIVTAVLAFWAVSILVIAWFAFRRRNWARITLVVSAVIAIPVLGLASLAIVPGFLLIGAIATIVLVFTGGANEWYRNAGTPAPQPGQPTYY